MDSIPPGWTENTTDTPPAEALPVWSRVEVLLRNGEIYPADDFPPRQWKDTGDIGVVIAWRVTEPVAG